MQKINVQVEIPESMDNFLNLLPLNIRKQYLTVITNAVLKQNEKLFIENIQNIVRSLMTIAISSKDEEIMQEELDKSLNDLAIKMNPEDKTIKGKAKKETLKKTNIVSEVEEIQPTVLKEDISNQVENFKSNETKEELKTNVLGSEHVDLGIKDQNKDFPKQLDLNSMFNR